MDNVSFAPSVSPPVILFVKEKNPTKTFTFSVFDFSSSEDFVFDSTPVTTARGDSHKRDAVKSVLNSPHNASTSTPGSINFKAQEWMSDGYLDSMYSLPLRAHTDKGLTGLKTVEWIVSIEEVEDEDDLSFNAKEKLGLDGPLLESVVPAEWLLTGYFVRGTQGNQMDVKLQLTMLDTQQSHSVTALLDTGCTGSTIDSNFVKRNCINTQSLYAPIPVYNTDGTHNTGGPITNYVELHVKVQDHIERLMLVVTDLGKSKIFLGYDWLKAHNPSIDWAEDTITFDRCPTSCGHKIRAAHIEEDIEEPMESEMDAEPVDPEDHLEDRDSAFLFDYGEYLSLNRHFEKEMAHDHYQHV